MGSIENVLEIIPMSIRRYMDNINDYSGLQEIRIRINKPVILVLNEMEKILPYNASGEDLLTLLKRMSSYSIYAYDEEIKQGFVTIRGGHRVGICGRCVVDNQKIKTIKDINSINIRVCKEIIGASDGIMRYMLENNSVKNTIIISPPKCGKTTLLRDITRNLSNGMKGREFRPKQICIVDERSEIAACFRGESQMNIGIRTDVLDSCPKSSGIMMAIRSMSPEVIICDEIGTEKDMESVVAAMNSGVNLITTIHGFGIEDLYRKQVFHNIMQNEVFEIAIVLNNLGKVGHIDYIYDFKKKKKVVT